MLELSSIKKELIMPNIKSAKKKVSVIARRKQENRYVKSTMATMIKNFREAVKTDVAKAESMLKDIVSYIDSAESKGVIHKSLYSDKAIERYLLNFTDNHVSSELTEDIKEVFNQSIYHTPPEYISKVINIFKSFKALRQT